MPTHYEHGADVRFRWLPAIYWKPASPSAIKACELDVLRRWENLCFGWLHIEVETGAFRCSRAAA